MASREFAGADGRRWTVWYVTPWWGERRSSPARRLEQRGTAAERRQPDAARGRAVPRFEISSALARGWLCFQHEDEKRRLTPVPPGWERMSDLGLEALCERAVRSTALPACRVARPRLALPASEGYALGVGRSVQRRAGAPGGGGPASRRGAPLRNSSTRRSSG